MPSVLSIKLGDFLYKNVFPVYNIIYPIFKRKQDRHEIALLNQYIKKGDVVLDIGANIGFYTKILSELVGETGKVYAFEPDKTNFSHLKKNAGNLTNVEFINKAVSDKTGTITLYQSDLLNVDHKTYETKDYTSKTEIESVAMDDIIPKHRVDFIKIDIQGSELHALRGLKKIINHNKSIIILMEYDPQSLTGAGSKSEEFFRICDESGFTMFALFKNKPEEKIDCNWLSSNCGPNKTYPHINLLLRRV